MTSILIASHGKFASGLKSSIEILTGLGDKVTAVDAYVDESDYSAAIKNFIDTATAPAIIFTDIQGGSINQKVMLLVADHPEIMVVSQMNLAILLSVLLDTEELTPAHLDELIEQSQVKRVEIPKKESDLSDDDFFA